MQKNILMFSLTIFVVIVCSTRAKAAIETIFDKETGSIATCDIAINNAISNLKGRGYKCTTNTDKSEYEHANVVCESSSQDTFMLYFLKCNTNGRFTMKVGR